MNRPAIDRDRMTLVVVLLAAVVWHTATTWMISADDYWAFRMRFRVLHGYAITPEEPPLGNEPIAFSPGAMLEQAGTLGRIVIAVGVVMLASFLGGAVRILRARRPATRRLARLPLRLGVLALVLGIAGAAYGRGNDMAVLDRLVLSDHWLGTDRAMTPWGSVGLLAGGEVLALAGTAMSVGLAFMRRRKSSGGEAS